MKGKFKKQLILTSVITILPMVVGILLWDKLPAEIATHFDSYGEPNGWSSRTFTVFGLPLIITALNVLCNVTTESDPRRQNYPKKMMRIVYWICPVVSWIVAGAVYGYALGFAMNDIGRYLSLLLGIVLLVIGNYLPKVKQNFFLGIKLPWTYASEDNWNKTHRFSAVVWMAGGVFMLINFFLQIRGIELWVILAIIILPAVYSWMYWMKNDRKKEG